MGEFERLARDFSWSIAEMAECRAGVWFPRGLEQDSISYPESRSRLCAEVESGSFWFQHRNRVIGQHLMRTATPEAIWDVGGGNGYVSQHLQAQGIRAVVVEPGEEGVAVAAGRGLKEIFCGTFDQLGLPDDSLPAIGCFDVLEHLAQPGPLLQEFHRTLRPGGVLAVTVPALSVLWSQYDISAGHFIRYSRRSLRSLVQPLGFDELTSNYFMMSLVLPMFLLRSLPYRLRRIRSEKELDVQHRRQLGGEGQGIGNRVLAMLLRGEASIMRWIRLPVGTSIIALYRKQAGL